MSTLDKDYIRIFYLNINGNKIKKRGSFLSAIMFKPKENWCRYHKFNRDKCSLEKEPYYIKIQKFTEESVSKE